MVRKRGLGMLNRRAPKRARTVNSDSGSSQPDSPLSGSSVSSDSEPYAVHSRDDATNTQQHARPSLDLNPSNHDEGCKCDTASSPAIGGRRRRLLIRPPSFNQPLNWDTNQRFPYRVPNDQWFVLRVRKRGRIWFQVHGLGSDKARKQFDGNASNAIVWLQTRGVADPFFVSDDTKNTAYPYGCWYRRAKKPAATLPATATADDNSTLGDVTSANPAHDGDVEASCVNERLQELAARAMRDSAEWSYTDWVEWLNSNEQQVSRLLLEPIQQPHLWETTASTHGILCSLKSSALMFVWPTAVAAPALATQAATLDPLPLMPSMETRAMDAFDSAFDGAVTLMMGLPDPGRTRAVNTNATPLPVLSTEPHLIDDGWNAVGGWLHV